MKKNKYIPILIVILLLLLPFSVSATDSILDIHVSVELLDDGSAAVTQVWETISDEGTEYYIPMSNLNHMKIRDFHVTDEKGNVFETMEPWDVDGSFEEKAFRCGINMGEDGPELCFGKSETGPKTYTLTYVLENAVQAFPDMDGFNIRFINDQMEPTPASVSVEIFKEGIPLTENNAKIWGFGYEGSTEFKDGVIVAKNDGSFDYEEHVTLLLGLEKGILNPVYQGHGTFEELKEEAMKGSDWDNFSGKLKSGLSGLAGIIGVGIVAVVGIFSRIGSMGKKSLRHPKNIKEAKTGEVDYFRDIPLGGHIPAIFYFHNMGSKNKKNEEYILSAYFLKWIRDGALEPIFNPEEMKGFLKKRKKQDFFKINGKPKFQSTFENELWGHIYRASGSDRVLDNKEMKYYLEQHTEGFITLFDSLYEEGAEYALDNNLVKVEKGRFVDKYYLTPDGINAYRQVQGMKKYLEDYTLIKEREAKEVELWDHFLILGVLFGIGDKVIKNFEQLQPDYRFANLADDRYDNRMLYYNTTGLSVSMYQSYAKTASGGGGSSSSGGGGGFSGGGSGGGSR